MSQSKPSEATTNFPASASHPLVSLVASLRVIEAAVATRAEALKKTPLSEAARKAANKVLTDLYRTLNDGVAELDLLAHYESKNPPELEYTVS